jgi:hypothetical protein
MTGKSRVLILVLWNNLGQTQASMVVTDAPRVLAVHLDSWPQAKESQVGCDSNPLDPFPI